MSLSPQDHLSDHTTFPTPRIKLEEFMSSQQERMNVYLRIRPLLPAEILQDNKMCICVEDDHTVRAVAPLDSAKFKSSAHNSALEQIFRFTQTFGPEVGQIQFFEETMKTTLENFIQGQNELVFAYGSTGSGKTYTMQGGLDEAEPGLIPLTIHLLFGSIRGKQVISPSFKPYKYSDVIKLGKLEQEREETAREKLLSHLNSKDFDDSKNLLEKSSVSLSTIFSDDSLDATSHSNMSDKGISILESALRLKNTACDSVSMQGEKVLFSIWVSSVEIYKENIYDLLDPFTSNKRTRLSLNEDENKNIYVKGLREIHVTSTEEALKLFNLGRRNSRTASTRMNYRSSRSHFIFTIKIIQVLDAGSPLSARVNRLSYCDLAGSERTAETQNTGVKLKEAGKINTSLLALGRCIEALRQQGPNDKTIIPYQDSKLTKVFSAYFTGKGKTSMIINVSPASHIFAETLNVLKFSALAKQVASNDLSRRLLSYWNKKISQLTENWEKSCSRWSNFCKSDSQKDSVNTISETPTDGDNVLEDSFDEVIQRDQFIEELLTHFQTMTDELREVMKNLETEIRAQVCREFTENFVRIDNCYREQLKASEESGKTASQQVRTELKCHFCKDADEEHSTEDSCEECDDEKGYASAHEDTPPPVLSRAVEDSENEMHEDKCQRNDSPCGRSSNDGAKAKSSPRKSKERKQKNGLKESEVKRYETLLSAKDEEIKELQRKIEEQDNAKNSVDKELVEYESILSSKGEEVLRLKEDLMQKDEKIALHETKLKELEDIINKRNEINQLREQFESEIASKDVELKECLKSLNSKTQELTDLNEKIEEMKKVIASNEKNLQECNSVLSLKDVEITFLKGSDGSKANGMKQYETDLHLKEDQILKLKKQLEDEQLSRNENEDELKECEIKDAEIAELKRNMEKFRKDVASMEKEIEDYKNIVDLKNTEIYLLQGKGEENASATSESETEAVVKSKDESIARLKKEAEDHRKSIFFKDKELEQCRNNLNSKEQELSALKQKFKNSELKEYKKSLNSKEAEITRLKKKIGDLEGSVISKETLIQELESTIQNGGDILATKDSEILELQKQLSELKNKNRKSRDGRTKEDNNIIKSQGMEITKLNGKIEELSRAVAMKDSLVRELEIKVKETEEALSFKNAEVLKLHQRLPCIESTDPECGDIKVREEESRTTEEISGLDDKRIIELQKTMSSFESEALSKDQAWQNVQYLTELVHKLSKTLATQQGKLSAVERKCNDLTEQVTKGKNKIQEFNKKTEEKEKLLLEKTDEIERLQFRLDEKEQEFCKKLEEQDKSLLEKNDVIEELKCKLEYKVAEEEKSKEQLTVSEKQIKSFGELVKLLQTTEFHSYNMITDLRAKVEALISKTEEEEKEKEEAAKRWKAAEERWKAAEEGKQEAEEERRKAEEERRIAEEEKRIAEEEKKIAEEERRKAEEERRKAEEEKRTAEEERRKTEHEKRKSVKQKKKERTEKEIQTENCEPQKHERGVQTEYYGNENISVDSGDSQCKVVQHHYKKKFKHATTQEKKDLKTYDECHSDEESGRIDDAYDEEGASEADEGSVEIFDGDNDEKNKKSTDSDTNHRTQAAFGAALISCLQWIEMIAAQNTVRLSKENRSYCKKLLSLSDDMEIMRIKLAAAELTVSEKENVHRKLKSENLNFEPKQELLPDSQGSLNLIETLQKIDHISAESISKFSDENLRLVHENRELLEQVQTSAVELQLVNQEIDRKDEEYRKIQSDLRKKDARIVYLESEISKCRMKPNKLETKSKVQLLEEQTQHGTEVEQAMALKRQVETDYRSLERKFRAATGDVEESMQTKTHTESTEDIRQRKKQGRTKHYKGRKWTSTEEDEDCEPSQKKRMVKSHCDDDDSNTCSTEAEELHSTETSSSFQRLQEFVVEKTPIVKPVAQRMSTSLNSKSGSEDSSSATHTKQKLFSSTYSALPITSPVQETVKISSKKTVNRKFHSKKDPK